MQVDSRSFDYASMIDPMVVRKLAVSITSASIDTSPPPNVGYMAEVFEWVRGNVRYVPDPVGIEYVQSPQETLEVGAGDCEDMAILVASLYEAVGIPARLLHVESYESGHMYAQARCGPLSPKAYADAITSYYERRFSRSVSGVQTTTHQGLQWVPSDPACATHLGDYEGYIDAGYQTRDGGWVRGDRLRLYYPER